MRPSQTGVFSFVVLAQKWISHVTKYKMVLSRITKSIQQNKTFLDIKTPVLQLTVRIMSLQASGAS